MLRLKTTLLLVGFAGALFGQTQHYTHTTFWYRGLVAVPLSKNWDFYGEYIHRQQNEIGSSNPFTHESFEEVRLWLHLKKGNWTVQFNPISYIHSVPFLGKLADYTANPNQEWRAAASLELKQNVAKWTFKERAQYEFRFPKSLDYALTTRFRLKGLAQIAISDKTKLTLSDELWLNMPPNQAANHFDQNWIYVGMSQQVCKVLSLELGYRRNLKERSSTTEFDDENGIDLTTAFRF